MQAVECKRVEYERWNDRYGMTRPESVWSQKANGVVARDQERKGYGIIKQLNSGADVNTNAETAPGAVVGPLLVMVIGMSHGHERWSRPVVRRQSEQRRAAKLAGYFIHG
jgi:hypothetical protein